MGPVKRSKFSEEHVAYALRQAGWAPGAKAISENGLVAEERILHPALTMVP